MPHVQCPWERLTALSDTSRAIQQSCYTKVKRLQLRIQWPLAVWTGFAFSCITSYEWRSSCDSKLAQVSSFFVPGTLKLSQLRSERLARFQQKHNTKLMHVRWAFVAFTLVGIFSRGRFWRVSC